jgi:hypothetical protein
MAETTDGSLRMRLEDAFWERHSNPKSGWSRTLLTPMFVLACYRRDPQLFVVAVVATVLNPIVFPPPAPDTGSWMTRGVRAERWWLERGGGTLGLGWPNLLNVLNLPAFAYALYAAYTRRPVRAAVATALSVGLKFGWIELIARRYDDAREADDPPGQSSSP